MGYIIYIVIGLFVTTLFEFYTYLIRSERQDQIYLVLSVFFWPIVLSMIIFDVLERTSDKFKVLMDRIRDRLDN